VPTPAERTNRRTRRALSLAARGAAAALLLGLLPGPLTAATAPTIYVDRANVACSDSGAGTIDQPFCTIGRAASLVTAGQTVQVAVGTYPERVAVPVSGTPSAPIVFTAAPGASVTLSGQANGFYIAGRSWITVQRFSIVNTTDYGISVSNSSHITLSGNHVSYSGKPVSGMTKYGIRLNNVTDSLVSDNIVDHNTNAGIGLVGGSTRDEVFGNESFSNAQGYQRAAAGIHLYDAPGNVVANNITHDNEDSGINCYPNSNNCVIYNNVAYNNGDHGIDDSFASGAQIVANTVYNNVTAGINVEGNATGATVANNISVDNGIKSPRTHSDIRVEAGSTAGTTMDYNLVYLTRPDTLLIWNSVSYTSLSAFQSATGQEAHGIAADPRWANVAAGDFHLLAGSPAIDSANSAAPAQPSLDVEGNARVDDPGTPNTGAGPRAYDDRGAYEFDGGSLDHIVISPVSATITAGGSQTYTAEGFDRAGNSVGDVTAFTAFSIAPNGTCSGNTCTATSAGAHTVTGNDGGRASTASLTVAAGPPDHLALSPVSATKSVGQSQTYTAEALDQYENSLGDVTDSATFSIAPEGACAGATCTGSQAGAHTVTGSWSGATGSASLNVVLGGTLDHISISPQSATINVGGSQAYTATGFDAAGDSLGDVTASTTFSISPEGTCTGNVCSANAGGPHTVTGTNSGKTNTASLAVSFVRNSGFETDLVGWNTSGSGANITLTRASGGHSGAWAAKLTNTGASASTYATLQDSPNWVTTTSPGTYTGTLWARADAPGAILKLKFQEYSGATLVGTATAQMALTTSWQQLTVSYAIKSPGSALDFQSFVANPAAGAVFYADDASIVLG
jgi:parallel beta-helix repeat protein